jgi:NADH-quinone oxidoreductase subunit L
MFVGVGSGAYTAGIFHLFTHAFFKAGLFLAAGSVMHAMGNKTDIMEMGGLKEKTPITRTVFLIYCLAIAGIPIFAGFFSKDEILLAAFTAHHPGWPAWYGKVLWGVLSVAALGTSFYMFRLYYLVFHGKSRADAVTQAHIHESPPVMTVPLVILAAGATLLGLLGMPEFLAPSFIGQWLGFGAEEHGSETTTLALMGAATGLAIIGWAAARALYREGPETAARLSDSLGGLKRLVQNKFYVDEIYDFIIVRPFNWICRGLFWVVDRIMIDKIVVEGPARVLGVVARVTRAYQNGDLQRYLVAMLIGVGGVLFFSTCQKPDIEVDSVDGATVKLHTNLGDGVTRRLARASWDFDGDGKPDASGENVAYTFPKPGKHTVTVTVTDAFHKPHTRSLEIEVGQ